MLIETYLLEQFEAVARCGTLLKASEELNIDLKKSWMIGDSKRDIEAGKNAGCKTISIREDFNADYIADDLSDAINYILGGKNG